MELVELLAVPAVQVAERKAQQIQGAGPLGSRQVDGQLEHLFLLQGVTSGGHRREQAPRAHEEGDVLLGRRAQAEAADQAPGRRDGTIGLLVAGGVDDQRREQRPVGVFEDCPGLAGLGVALPKILQVLEHLPPHRLCRVELEGIDAPAAQRLGQFGEGPVQHPRELEEPPRADRAPIQYREKLRGRRPIPAQR